MMEMLNYGVMGVVIISSTLYVWSQLLEQNFNYKSPRFWFIFIALIVIAALNYQMVNKFIRIVCITIVLSLACNLMFRISIKSSVIVGIISEVMIMMAETIFVIIISVIFNSGGDFIENTQFGTILANTAIAILMMLLAQLDIFKKLYLFCTKITKNIKNGQLIIFILALATVINFLAATTYYKLEFRTMLIFNIITTMIYFTVIIMAWKNKQDYIEVYDKYNTTISSLREYEDILNKYRISNHENKNQLMTIRNMIKNKEKNIVSYIDTVVENKLKDNEMLMARTIVIPEGGLRGLVYSKSLLMREKRIDFDLSIDKAIHTTELIELGDETVLDICKIMGAFLDNAIEAVEKLEEKFIDLEMSIEKEKLFISVTNNYEGVIDIDHMEEKGFTTKGENHGYGLSLVKELISKNKLLKNEKMITNDEFTQRLIINLAKKK